VWDLKKIGTSGFGPKVFTVHTSGHFFLEAPHPIPKLVRLNA